ncbi:site-specific integrase [Pseudaminobacter arsenicus]|uniref:Site-specific integrase n=1 Tax=Borborobacter arsenicus TaxID=1851146 RepID=A0A432V9U9_9HYPH|nr:site-specific integrase [Pseudaminobacter arsenicus]RUM98978.1 site-specific integrase [Pseudaminobacter arsenicus]
MGLKLLKRGKTYYLRGTVAGHRVYETTGTGDKDLAEAIRIRKEGRLANEAAHGLKAVATFDEAADSYTATGAPTRFIADVRKTDGVASGLAVYFRGRKLSDIKQADLDKAARELYPSASRETLIRQVYTPFIAVWNHAARKEMCDVRVWERPRKAKGTNVIVLKSERSGTAPVEYDYAARFVAALSPDPAMLMTFLFYTGLRPIEAFALRAEDVSIDKRWFVVRSSKTGQPRGVPLHSFLCGWLPALVDRGGALFRTPRGEPYGIVQDGGGGLKTAIKGARKRSGIRDISPYTARHTVSTQLVVAGVHPHIKDQILGHAADDMSRHYTNVPQAPLIEAIDKLPVGDFAKLPWVSSPGDWFGKLAEGTGRRTDLERNRAGNN